MKIVLFSLFGINVYSHGVFLTLAMIIGGLLLFRLANKEQLETKNFLYNYVVSLITGVFASRILFYLININSYQNIYQVAEIWEGGLVSFAGFVAGAFAFYLLLKTQKQKILPWFDLTGIVFPLALAIGRIGCVLNGEIGIKSNSIISYYGYAPVAAFEIYLGIAIFIINFSLYLYAKKHLIPYFLIFNFVAFYSFVRIFIDSYRADPSLLIGINLSQLTSLMVFIIAIISFSLYFYKGKWRQNGSR